MTIVRLFGFRCLHFLNHTETDVQKSFFTKIGKRRPSQSKKTKKNKTRHIQNKRTNITEGKGAYEFGIHCLYESFRNCYYSMLMNISIPGKDPKVTMIVAKNMMTGRIEEKVRIKD